MALDFYVDLKYERTKRRFDELNYRPVFVRADTIVVSGLVIGDLTGLTVRASVCKVLPNGSIGAPSYSRTVGSGIIVSNINQNEKYVAVTLLEAGDNSNDEPGQAYVADIEFSYDADYTIGTTVGDPVPMRHTIKGGFSIEQDYTTI